MTQALARHRRRYYAGGGFPTAPVLGGLAILGGGALLYYFRDELLQYSIQAAGLVGWFPDPSSRAAPYAAMIASAASSTGVDPSLIAGIGDRESGWGVFLNPKGAGGTGDGGNGLGLMQLDVRYNPIANWQDPQANILKGAQVYAAGLAQLTGQVDSSIILPAAVAAYNAGVQGVLNAIAAGGSPDDATTGGNYSQDVLARAAKYSAGASS